MQDLTEISHPLFSFLWDGLSLYQITETDVHNVDNMDRPWL